MVHLRQVKEKIFLSSFKFLTAQSLFEEIICLFLPTALPIDLVALQSHNLGFVKTAQKYW